MLDFLINWQSSHTFACKTIFHLLPFGWLLKKKIVPHFETFCRQSGDKYFCWHNFSWRAFVFFNKENMESWVIKIFVTIKEYLVLDQEVCILLTASLTTGIVNWVSPLAFLCLSFIIRTMGKGSLCCVIHWNSLGIKKDTRKHFYLSKHNINAMS